MLQRGFPGGSVVENLPATKLVCHNYWAHVQQRLKPELPWTRALKPESSFCLPQLEKSPHGNKDPKQAKLNLRKRKEVLQKLPSPKKENFSNCALAGGRKDDLTKSLVVQSLWSAFPEAQFIPYLPAYSGRVEMPPDQKKKIKCKSLTQKSKSELLQTTLFKCIFPPLPKILTWPQRGKLIFQSVKNVKPMIQQHK